MINTTKTTCYTYNYNSDLKTRIINLIKEILYNKVSNDVHWPLLNISESDKKTLSIEFRLLITYSQPFVEEQTAKIFMPFLNSFIKNLDIETINTRYIKGLLIKFKVYKSEEKFIEAKSLAKIYGYIN